MIDKTTHETMLSIMDDVIEKLGGKPISMDFEQNKELIQLLSERYPHVTLIDTPDILDEGSFEVRYCNGFLAFCDVPTLVVGWTQDRLVDNCHLSPGNIAVMFSMERNDVDI